MGHIVVGSLVARGLVVVVVNRFVVLWSVIIVNMRLFFDQWLENNIMMVHNSLMMVRFWLNIHGLEDNLSVMLRLLVMSRVLTMTVEVIPVLGVMITTVAMVVVASVEVVMVESLTMLVVRWSDVARTVAVNRHQMEMLLVAIMLITVVFLLGVAHFVPVVAISAIDTSMVEVARQSDIWVGHLLNVMLNIKLMLGRHPMLIPCIGLFLLSQQVMGRLERSD